MPNNAAQLQMLDAYDMAKACKGVITWDSSQSFAQFGAHAGRGVCLASACYYIQLHRAGKSLREFLGMYMNGRSFVPINMDAMALLQTEQRHFRNFDTHAFKAWLNYKSGVRVAGSGHGTLAIGGEQLRQSVFAMSDGYMLFEFFYPESDGHALAAYFKTRNGRTYVSFYDANLGEILFRDQEHFFHFFDYLMTMTYNTNKDCRYEFLHLR